MKKAQKIFWTHLIKDKPLKPGSYRGRKIHLLKKTDINGENHA